MYNLFEGKPIPQSPEEIPLDAWFSESYKFQPNTFIFEQCLKFAELNSVLVILWEGNDLKTKNP